MTRKWAIEILKHDIYLDKRGMTYSHDAVGIEALEMAIEALTDIENIKKMQEAQNKLYKKIFEGGSFLPLPDCMLKEGDYNE